MRSTAINVCLAALLWAGFTFQVEGAVHVVQMLPSNRFNPSQLTIDFGDTVRWQSAGGSHDVESNLREGGVAFFKSPPPPVGQFEFKFERVGTFTYRCNPHVSFGMTGSITVRPAASQPPTVSITSPAAGATFVAPASVTVQAQATDPDGTVAKVDFFSNGNLVGTAASAPFTITLNDVAAGNYSLTATATDSQGATATSVPVNIIVNEPQANQPPTVSITSPAAGATFIAPASVTVQAEAADSDGTVAKVDFFSNGNLVGTVTTPPFTVTLDNVAAGNYALTATATDNQNAMSTSRAVNVVVNQPTANNPPTVAITSPATGLFLAAPGAVTLEATASDTDGSVSEVAFFRAVNRGGPSPGTLEPLGAVTSAPYKLALSDLQPGFYHIVAQATDNQAAKTLSAEVVLTIHTPVQVDSIARAAGETVLRVRDSILPGPFTLSAQASSDLQNWTDLSGTFASVAGGLLELKDTSGLEHRFYRVRAQFQEVPPAN